MPKGTKVKSKASHSSEKVVLTVVGARPQFIKACALSKALVGSGIPEMIVHTGQHYDLNMSDVFFQKLDLPTPAYHLGVGSGTHGKQTAAMIDRLERVMMDEKPALVLVYGDTNSTLSGALAAIKLHIPVAHVEAGLRSFNRSMPEEVNRVLTDHISSLLFAPTKAAVQNLASEGIVRGAHLVGDVMYDTAISFRRTSQHLAFAILNNFSVSPKAFVYLTIHRAENTDNPERWRCLLDAIGRVSREVAPVIWPVHPRTRVLLQGIDMDGVVLTDPLPYFESQALAMNARVVLTDSGGLQKEAAFYGTPCVTLRDETEWVELVCCGVNRIAGADPDRIVDLAKGAHWPESGIPADLYGTGHASELVAGHIQSYLMHAGTEEAPKPPE